MFCSDGTVAGTGCKTLACALAKSWYTARCLAANGPAIWGGCVTRRQHRHESVPIGHKAVTVQGGYGACFCNPGTNFIKHYACRGTSLVGARKLSSYRIFVGGTGAASRYKLSRSQKTVTVHYFNCRQMRVSGCIFNYKAILGAGAKAKTVTIQLTHIVRVMGQALFICLDTSKLSSCTSIFLFCLSWCRNFIVSARGKKILELYRSRFASSLFKL